MIKRQQRIDRITSVLQEYRAATTASDLLTDGSAPISVPSRQFSLDSEGASAGCSDGSTTAGQPTTLWNKRPKFATSSLSLQRNPAVLAAGMSSVRRQRLDKRIQLLDR